MRRIVSLALLCLAFCTATTLVRGARAQGVAACGSPRAAARSVALSADLTRGAKCLDSDEGSDGQRVELVRRVRSVVAAAGVDVEVDDLSSRSDYVDAGSGESVVPLHPDLPWLVLYRADDGRWLVSAAALERVSAEYQAALGSLHGFVESLPEAFRGALFGVQVWQYLALGLLFIAGLVIRKLIAFIVLNRIRSVADRFGQAWATRVVDVFASPGATLIMAGVLHMTYPELRLPLRASFVMQVAVRVLVVLSVVWAAYRSVDVVSARLAKKAEETDSKLDDQLVPLVRKALKVLVVIAGALFILQNLDVDVGSLLAGLGIGGIAFALAAKDTLANFFGSVMIFLDRPFQIGDWIKIGDVEGVVEEVGFRSTRIRTFYNSLVTVPNATFTESKIDNMGVREFRRCFVTLGVTYDTTPEQMQAFVEGIRGIVLSNPCTRKDYFEVHMSGFGAYSLDVMVYFFFKVASWTDELTERHRIFLEIMRLARDLGVGFAFPTQTVHVDHVAQMGAERNLTVPLPATELEAVVDGFAPGGSRARPSGPRISRGYTAGSRAGGDSGEG